MTESIAPFYADWAGYNRRTIAALRTLSADDLALPVQAARGPDIAPWPIWAVAAHTVGARVFWLCHVLGEPGAERTPFTDPSGFGWEDDLATVRTGDEVVGAWESTWSVVEGCLERWTPAMLAETVRRAGRTSVQVHSRQSILLRLITHEAYHVGELSLTLALNGREPIDLWPAADWTEEPSAG